MRKISLLILILISGFAQADHPDCQDWADAAMHDMNTNPDPSGADRWLDLICQYDCE